MQCVPRPIRDQECCSTPKGRRQVEIESVASSGAVFLLTLRPLAGDLHNGYVPVLGSGGGLC